MTIVRTTALSLAALSLALAVVFAPTALRAHDNHVSGVANAAGDVASGAGDLAGEVAVGAGNIAGEVAGPIPRKAGELAGTAAKAAGNVAEKTLDFTADLLDRIF